MNDQRSEAGPPAPRKSIRVELEVRRFLGVLLVIGAVAVLIDGRWLTTGAFLVIGALLQPELVEASRIGAKRWQRLGATLAMIPASLVMYVYPPAEKPTEAREPTGPMPAALMVVAQQRIKGKLRDPDSAKFRDVRVGLYRDTNLVCGYVNSRNGFGGMTGYQRFAVSGMAVLEEEMAPGEMDLIWSHCPLS